MRRRRAPEIIAGRVNADGTIAAGDGFTVVKGTAGAYTFTFQAGFRVVSFVMTLVGPTAGFATMNTPTGALQIYNNGSVATDIPFNFIATGIQQ